MDNNAQVKQQELVVRYDVNGSEIKLSPSIVQNYIVGNNSQITMAEFKFFTELCKARGLNPFLKEVYCIKYGSQPATIVVSKDVIEQRAEDFPQYDGKESGIIVRDKETGEIIERPGCFWIRSDEDLLGGWCRVYRKDRSKPEYMSVSIDEVAQKKSDGSYNSNWSGKPATMVEKVAKVRALRAAFPKSFSGMYIADEVVKDAKAKRDTRTYENDSEAIELDYTITDAQPEAPQEESAEPAAVSLSDL